MRVWVGLHTSYPTHAPSSTRQFIDRSCHSAMLLSNNACGKDWTHNDSSAYTISVNHRYQPVVLIVEPELKFRQLAAPNWPFFEGVNSNDSISDDKTTPAAKKRKKNVNVTTNKDRCSFAIQPTWTHWHISIVNKCIKFYTDMHASLFWAINVTSYLLQLNLYWPLLYTHQVDYA